MKLCEIAKRFGIEEYPEVFSEYFETKAMPHPVFSREFILDAEERLGVFTPAHVDNVISEAEKICLDKEAAVWLSLICYYLESCTIDEARQTGKLIPVNYAEISEMYPLYPIAAMIPRMERFYREHGFEGEELRVNFNVFEISLRLSAIAQKKPAFTRTY